MNAITTRATGRTIYLRACPPSVALAYFPPMVSSAHQKIKGSLRHLCLEGTVPRTLAKDDPTFLERCFQHPDPRGRKLCRIARTPAKLYPRRSDLRDSRVALPGARLVALPMN